MTTSVPCFDQSLGPFDSKLGHLGVLLGRTVECAGDDLTLYRTPHVGDFFGSLVDQQHHQVNIGIVGFDRMRDLLHHRCLAGLWRRDDEAALALTDRRHQIDDARGEIHGVAGSFELQLRIGKQRSEVFELRSQLRNLGIVATDFFDTQKCRILLVAGGRTAHAFDVITLAQTVFAHLRNRYVDIAGGRQETLRAKKSEAFVPQLQKTGDRHGLALERSFCLFDARVVVCAATFVAVAVVTIVATASTAPAAITGVATTGFRCVRIEATAALAVATRAVRVGTIGSLCRQARRRKEQRAGR